MTFLLGEAVEFARLEKTNLPVWNLNEIQQLRLKLRNDLNRCKSPSEKLEYLKQEISLLENCETPRLYLKRYTLIMFLLVHHKLKAFGLLDMPA